MPAWLAPFGVGAVVLAVAAATMTTWPVGVFYDDGIYLVLGKSLATGEGYRYLNLPGHPAATHYPPGYPALLALLWLVAPSFPANVALFKLANAVLLALAAGRLFLFARRSLDLGPAPAAVAILLGCLTVPVIAVTGVLFSEPLFLAMLALALPACERALRDDRPRAVLVAASLAAATTLVRSIGLPLVGALVLVLLVRRRWRSAGLAAAVAGAMLLPWQAWTAAHSTGLPRPVAASYGSYTSAIRDAVRANGVAYVSRVVLHNTRDLARPLGAVFAPGTGRVPRALVVAALLGLLALGGVGLARRAPVTGLFLLGYAGIVIAWPYRPDRFLWGVWPVLLLTLAVGASVAVGDLRARPLRGSMLAPRGLAAGVALLLALGLTRYNARGYQQRWWASAQKSAAGQLVPLVEWVERNTRPDDVIASDGDAMVHLYTGRHTVPSARWSVEAYPAEPSAAARLADLRGLLDAYPVRFVLLGSGQSTSAAAAAALSDGADRRLQMLTVLPGGGAAFIAAPNASHE